MPALITRLQRAFVLVIPAVAACMGSSVQGEVTFYLQRQGSEEDNGRDELVATLEAYFEEDFEGPQTPEGASVPTLIYGDWQLNLAGQWSEPSVPIVVTSSEFNVPGRVDDHALLVGHALTITPDEQTPLIALGLWIFDDRSAYDSICLIEVTETDGTVWQAALENEIAMNGYGHEIEGFAGAFSNRGIASMRVIAIDPATGEPIEDVLEVDHWIIAVDATDENDGPNDKPFVEFGPPRPLDREVFDGRPYRRWQEKRRIRPQQKPAEKHRLDRREHRRLHSSQRGRRLRDACPPASTNKLATFYMTSDLPNSQ